MGIKTMMMTNKTVGIISAFPDPHVDKVVGLLSDMKIDVLRIDSNNITSNNYLGVSFKNDQGFFFISDHHEIPISQLKSLWFRKPHIWANDFEPQNEEIAISVTFKKSELLQVLRDELFFYASRKKIFLVSDINAIKIASNKINQLLIAEILGFQIPKSIVTSDPEEIETFLKSNPKAIIKNIGKGSVRFGHKQGEFYTTPLTMKKFQSVRAKSTFDYPILVQEEVKRNTELRITVVGNKIFPCSITTNKPTSETDWRKIPPNQLIHQPFHLPKDIEEKCFALTRYYGLQYSAIDMAVNTENEYIFYEINPNGQYLWIEEEADLPISQAIAELLADPIQNCLK